MTPMKAIRAKCLDCCCNSSNEVRLCAVEKCPLYPYRFGKNPNRAGIGNHNAFFSQIPNSAQDSGEEPSGEYTSITPDTNSAKPLVSPALFEETEE